MNVKLEWWKVGEKKFCVRSGQGMDKGWGPVKDTEIDATILEGSKRVSL